MTIVNNLVVIRISKHKKIFTYFWVTHWSIYTNLVIFKDLKIIIWEFFLKFWWCWICKKKLWIFKHNENWGRWDVLNIHPKATKLTHAKKKIRVKSFDFCTFVKRHLFSFRCQTNISVFSLPIFLACVSPCMLCCFFIFF